MSLLFDQNLSRRLPTLLAAAFPGSEQVLLVGLDNSDDRLVWGYAAARGLAVVSKDSDFQHLSAVLGHPPKVIWLRVGNGPTRDVEALLRSQVEDIRTFLSDPDAAILELPQEFGGNSCRTRELRTRGSNAPDFPEDKNGRAGNGRSRFVISDLLRECLKNHESSLAVGFAFPKVHNQLSRDLGSFFPGVSRRSHRIVTIGFVMSE